MVGRFGVGWEHCRVIDRRCGVRCRAELCGVENEIDLSRRIARVECEGVVWMRVCESRILERVQHAAPMLRVEVAAHDRGDRERGNGSHEFDRLHEPDLFFSRRVERFPLEVGVDDEKTVVTVRNDGETCDVSGFFAGRPDVVGER